MQDLKAIIASQGISARFCNAACDAAPMTTKEYMQSKVDNDNAIAGALHLQDGYNCPLCKNRGYTAALEYNEASGYYTEQLIPCKCNNIRAGLKRLARSGLKDVVERCTFANYETPEDWQKTIKAKAEAFCGQLKSGAWFFFGGQSGAGKTHICTAIADKCIKAGMNCKYMLWRDEITRIKAVVNEPELYKRSMDELKQTDVLYIDDLFKGGKDEFSGRYKPPTAADVNAAFEIINYRYNTNRLTIISSERMLAELNDIDEAIAGRIAEKSKPGGYCISLRPDPSKNWRMKGGTEL